MSKVDFDELQHLATEVRRAQTSLSAGVQGFSGAPSAAPAPPVQFTVTPNLQQRTTIPDAVTTFGNTDAGAACLSAHHQAQSTMGAVLKAFDNTIDSDAERLELALAVYRKTDAEAADRLLATKRNQLDVFSTHMSTGGEHAPQQARQINDLRTIAGDQTMGNTVVGGDFNSVTTGNSPSAQALRGFGGHGFDVNGGVIHDGRGGTSASNIPIDHVMPRGVGASDAQRWARGQSDHDGQRVDLTLSNW
ncbi:hypothetical protein GCM10022225_84920 [Plantactinospora mayteni]|uniref:Endonuclease/exonuclease/phosphatase domain-containing protein n=2 Tax=Plantactinospora mayteni TaxID=566021 RepID=A0ABQ4F4S1_9ACTN|nr:hypothetical protein Pma05_84860 [Plantactinospora mayteni]